MLHNNSSIWKVTLAFVALVMAACTGAKGPEAVNTGGSVTLSKEVLQDKIKGAWAAQTIGVTFGRPAEFKYNSTMIPDYQRLE